MGLEILLYDDLNKLYITEKSNFYETNPFTKGYLLHTFERYGYSDVIKNVTGMDLLDIFEDIVNFEPNSYYPSKGILKKCLKKAKAIKFQLSYEFAFYVESIMVDLSEEYLSKEINAKMIREKISREWEQHNLNNLDFIKGYFNLNVSKKVIGIFPGRENIMDEDNLDCLYIALKCDLSSYIEATSVVIEFINRAIELEAPVIIWKFKSRNDKDKNTNK